MKNFIFYLATILIWGSTWIGIKLQLGSINPMVSVGLRFALAAILLLLWCRLKKLNLRFSRNDHLYIGLQGTFLFCFNYLLFYLAELQLTSGLAAVIFSTILLMNVINGRIFLGNPLDMRVIVGGILGLTGIVLVFKGEITTFSLDSLTFKAVLLCVLATYFASIGNILSARNQNHKLPLVQTNGLGMAYGALIMLGMALVTGKDFAIDPTLTYIGALCYLAIFGSIIAFGCYLALVGNIGPERAAYATLLFPIVALIISTIWEDYSWSQAAISGVILILCGNLHAQAKETTTDARSE